MTIEETHLTLPRSGITTRVLVSGQGVPLVLLHGNPDCADEWRNVLAALAGRYRAIAPDLPGYGRSPEPPPAFGWTVAEQVALLDEILAATGVTEPAIVVVHDVGAMMGIPWADANLERVRGLVVTNTVAFEGFEWFPVARRWGSRSATGRLVARLMMGLLGLRGGRLFRRAFGRQCPELSDTELDRFVRNFALNPAAKATTLRQFREVLRPDFFVGFNAMNARIAAARPVRVLWGDGDPFVPTERAHSFGDATVTVLPRVGHWVPIQAPAALAAEIDAVGAE